MRVALGNEGDNFGFTISQRRNRTGYPAESTSTLLYDLALLSDTLNHAHELLTRVDNAAATVGLHMNVSKTKVMAYNIEDVINLTTSSGSHLEQVQDCQCLDSWVDESGNEIPKTLA